MSASQALEWLHLDNTLDSVKVTTLPSPYFKFPPSNEPTTLPPPPDHSDLGQPFTIPVDIYNAFLSHNVPITIALVYISVITFLNSVNANRKFKPWWISKLRLFKLFVILHNTFLAVYSAWTFVGMVKALRLSLPAWGENTTVAETLDSLCKLHGPRGYGSAATYNTTTSLWAFTDSAFKLGADGLAPDAADRGRMWNEGLAFYGWIFYLSKFYEVIDTFIILAKGKKSSFLQTYHHAGAMICMWAGIRYMSPPIWMFVLVNSLIHSIMYTFYLFSVIGVRVPKRVKQTLTTLQITQFVVGATYAFAHLFVAYKIPVRVPYVYRLGTAVSSAASNLPTDASASILSAVSTASAGAGAWLKKLALRAAGHEGLAENVPNQHGQPFGIDALHIVEDLIAREETRYRDETQWVNCLDTSGQVFAILLNCLYLAPLTWLFLQFFITAYLKRVERRRSSTASDKAIAARQSLRDASKGVARRLSEVVEEMHRTSNDMGEDEGVFDGDEVKAEVRKAVANAKSQLQSASEKIKSSAPEVDFEKVKREVQRDLEVAKENIRKGAAKTKEVVSNQINAEQVKSETPKTAKDQKPATEAAKENVTEKGANDSEKASDNDNDVPTSPESTPNGSGTGAEEVTGQSSPEKKKKKKNKKLKEESSQVKEEKKEEEKIIDESQAIRDEDVKEEAKVEDSPSEVRDGTSFADAVKE